MTRGIEWLLSRVVVDGVMQEVKDCEVTEAGVRTPTIGLSARRWSDIRRG